ncbi:MAG: type I pullulanase [Acutalibacteraceae bacterium]
MLSKKIISGVMALIMLSSFFITSAEGKKTVDYKNYVKTLEKTLYSGKDLGANYSKEKTVFKVWSPSAEKVSVKLYETGSDDEKNAGYLKQRDMEYDKKTGVWSAQVKGDYKNKYYTYLITNNGKTHETSDIYAKACGVNGKRSMVVDLSSTNPKGWEKDSHVMVEKATDASVWEVHIKDFSYSESSGVKEENRGKYLAFTETGTTLNSSGNIETCVDYLKKLGIKYVELNPFYDFGSVDEAGSESQFNWGYDPVNYNCPEGSYSSNPYDGNVRIRECKAMIRSLHSAGIGVIMDVVYNHTYKEGNSPFDLTVPNYYYRMNSDGSYSNGSGCGNDTASEHKMFRKFMIESVAYWTKEYHIDGFRFDLMGLHDVETMNQIRDALDNLYKDGSGKKILMFGEAWNMQSACDDGTVLANQNSMGELSDRIGAFDDTMRDTVKGSVFNGKDGGFVQNGSGRASLKVGIEGQSNLSSGWAKAPTQTVTYASCHDNYALYDKLVLSVLGDNVDFRKRYQDLVEMNKLTSAIIYTSQGIPFMLAGEEFCRSKDGDENSYKSDVNLNAIDWNLVETNSDVVDYYRGMLEIRGMFTPFTDDTNETANSLYYFGSAPEGVLGYTACSKKDSLWKNVAVCFNGSSEEKTVDIEGVNLPKEWVIVADNYTAGTRNLGSVSNGKIKMSPHSAVVLVDKESFLETSKNTSGNVVVDFVDSETGDTLFTENISGEIGDRYDIGLTNSQKMKYTLVSKKDTKGTFKEKNQFATIKVKAYDGEYSTVTFRYVDEKGKDIYPSKVLKNQQGQIYFTPEIPSVEGYALNTESLPEKGAGVFLEENSEITYHYRKAVKSDACSVKCIYLSSSGEIKDIVTLKGEKGQKYLAEEKEYSHLSLYSTPENIEGEYTKTEQYVLFTYLDNTEDDNEMKTLFYFLGIGFSVIILVLVYRGMQNRKIKKKLSLDIDE